MTPVPLISLPELWIVAGPNGAGKTTLTQREPISKILPHVRFLNPDDIALAKLHALSYRGFHDAPAETLDQAFRRAADESMEQLKTAIHSGQAVGIETVLSTLKYQSLVGQVHGRQGFVGLIYVAISSPEIALGRVSDRVARGGHDVPAQKVQDRWRRSLENLPWFARNATAFWIFDNSISAQDGPPLLVAHGVGGRLTSPAIATFPELATALQAIR